MRRPLGFLLAAVLTPGLLRAAPAAIVIDHQPVACVAPGRFASLAARLEPADQVSRARLAFRSGGTTTWSFVEMRPDGAVFRGVLPQPKGDTKEIDYYIEATSRDMTPSRSAEHTAVVADRAECEKKGLAPAAEVESASITLDGGAIGVPAGFAATGIVSTGAAPGTEHHGVGAGTIIVGVIGDAAVIGAVVALTNKANSTATVSVDGQWAGNIAGHYRGAVECDFNNTLVLNLTQTGNSISGTGEITVGDSDNELYCGQPGAVSSARVTGTIAQTTVALSFTKTNFDGTTTPCNLGGTATTTAMGGGLACQDGRSTINGSWHTTKQ